MAQKKTAKSTHTKSAKKSAKSSAAPEVENFEESFDAQASEETQETHNGSTESQEAANETKFEESFGNTSESEEVRLDFPYSDMIRAYVPKAMQVADKVATDWKNEGSFMNLGIENPYANMAVSMGLQKAKEIEKKLEEKGVMSAVRMGFEVLKTQVTKKK